METGLGKEPDNQIHSIKRTIITSTIGVIILGVILAIGIGTGYLYQRYSNSKQKNNKTPIVTISTTPTVYPGWKMYKSQVSSYSFQAPDDWDIRLDEEGSSLNQINASTEMFPKSELGIPIDSVAIDQPITIKGNYSGDYLQYKLGLSGIENDFLSKTQDKSQYAQVTSSYSTIDGYKAFTTILSNKSTPPAGYMGDSLRNTTSKSVYIDLGNDTLFVFGGSWDNTNQAMQDTVNKILSTITPPKVAAINNSFEISSVDSLYDKYTNNSLGISIIFPKIASAETECTVTSSNPDGVITGYGIESKVTPVNIFEDLPNDKVYVNSVRIGKLISHTISPGVFGGASDSCTILDTTSNDIKNDVTALPVVYYTVGAAFTFKDINSDSDLKSFIQSQYGTEVTYTRKTTDKSKQNYSYTFSVPPDTPDANDVRGLHLIYSASKKLAVAWISSTQVPAWQLSNTGTVLTDPSASF